MADDSGNEPFPTSGSIDIQRRSIIVNKFPTLARLAAAVLFGEQITFTGNTPNPKLCITDNDTDEYKGLVSTEPTNMTDDVAHATTLIDRIYGLSEDLLPTCLYWMNNTTNPTIIPSQSRTDADDKAIKPSQCLKYWSRIASGAPMHGEHNVPVSINNGQRVHTCAPYDHGRIATTNSRSQAFQYIFTIQQKPRHMAIPWRLTSHIIIIIRLVSRLTSNFGLQDGSN
jgi:hypothetical protein